MAQEQKMKPGEFKFQPSKDWVVIKPIKVESYIEKRAKKSDIILTDGKAPKNILELEEQKAREQMTYHEFVQNAVKYFEGKHGYQGIVMAVGPVFEPEDEGYNKGDKIYYRGNSGEPIVHNKQVYWMLRPHEIYGKAPKNEFPIEY